ncbi:MAG: GTP 3',8-cyclase MoaA [Candidatus Bathyarchaeia archaeon]
MLTDPFGRTLTRLRISLTERCNLRCVYCDKEGLDNAEDEMSLEEVVKLADVGSRLGMSKVKLTGGEPLLRTDIVEVVRRTASLPYVSEVSMVTNGTLLADKAEALAEAGLRRVNVSLASLNPDVYRRICGGDVQTVLEGIRKAKEAGLAPIKLNTVVLKGLNEDGIRELMDFSASTGTVLQLIELHYVDGIMDESFFKRHYASLDAVEKELKASAVQVVRRTDMQFRPKYVLKGGLEVELVRFMGNCDFCAHCTRLRVTSDGKVKPCLMRDDNLVDALTALRKGAGDEELQAIFRRAVSLREPYQA